MLKKKLIPCLSHHLSCAIILISASETHLIT
uniref:Uncharacterized protein n=1 Tax=Anguilla anguilla TaxID=7936 RepID=A0A0E9VBB8_ANGAN